MNIQNEKGVALILTLFTLTMLIGFSAMYVLRTVQESKMVERDLNNAKSFYVSEGGAQAGLDGLDNLVNNFLLTTINNSNPNTLISYTTTQVTNGDGLAWLATAVQDNGTPVLTINGTQAEYGLSGTLGDGTYQYNLYITEKTDPVTVSSDMWDFPFNYRLESSGLLSGEGNQIVMSGDFTVRVQRDNFAKYALFTNNQQTPSGSNVWFTKNTNFAGPVHTNGQYNFYGNPSGAFENTVDQVNDKARFYNNGSPVLIDADNNGTKDVPVFNNSFNRNVSTVALSSPTLKQDLVGQASGGQSFGSDGIYVPNDATGLTGGVYVQGNANVTLKVDGTNRPLYEIVQGSTTKKITLDKNNNQTIVETVGAGSTTYAGLPDGVDDLGTLIYVSGQIDDLSGTVQSGEEVTVSSTNDIVIQNDIVYESYTSAIGNPGDAGYVPPNATGTTNKLGIVSWDGNVRVGTSAPDDVNVHGSILSQNGILTVDSYTNQGVGARGTATIMGGVITNDYGAFGLFNGSTGQFVSGYGRNFVYDDRMQSGGAPPYFPTLNTFVAFTNDITDKIVWQEGI